ncbi:C-type lectin domain-containing protein [Trichostrongylus colubriformis]|uniref:C-type lectin domain-containing protein n=1 Tax=Trichostrongylus colubriformis TaxID=6319 RepID=A0AAN8II42_TRICO
MNASGLCISFIVAMLAENFVWAQNSCSPWIYRIESQKCYRRFCDDLEPEDAQKACEKQGGNLVTICDAEENDFVSMMGYVSNSYPSDANGRTWIGYYRNPNNKEQWLWRSGSTCKYTNWKQGEPSGDGDYVQLYTWHLGTGENRQFWNDGTVKGLYFICERSTCPQEDVE